MSSGDFWCEEHKAWNCACYLPPAALTVSGGAMPRRRFEEIAHFRSIEDHEGECGTLHLGEDNYVTREGDGVTIWRKGGKPIVQMDYVTWKKLGGKKLG